MEKLYFLAPDLDSAGRIVNDFRDGGITDSNIHIVAKDTTELGDLPEASIMEDSDLVPAIKRGAAVGGAAGLLAGVAAVAFPPAGIALGGGALLASTVGGATFGAWTSSMIGSSVTNSHLQQFEQAIAAGQILILVEVEEDQVESTQALIRRHHPEAEIRGVEPSTPPPT